MDTTLLRELSDSDLLAQTRHMVKSEQRATAAVIGHLAEIGKRRLYLREGYRSLFSYCTGALHLSEHETYHRIEAGRLAARFPAVLAALERGDVHLTAVRLLAPYLTPANHLEVLAAAAHRSKREILVLVAGMNPQRDARAFVRKVPVMKGTPKRTPASPVSQMESAPPGALRTDDDGVAGPTRDGRGAGAGLGVDAGSAAAAATAAATGSEAFALTPPSPQRPAEVVPLTPERYKVQFTASAATAAKLRRAQELLRHRIPNGDVAAVIDQALDLLVRDLEKQKFAATSRPRPGVERGAGSVPSRHIPAGVKRAVWERDSGQCAFVSPNGVRCSERGQLEFDHIRPHADGGAATHDNVRLLCRAHNQYEAEQFFGVWQAGTG